MECNRSCIIAPHDFRQFDGRANLQLPLLDRFGQDPPKLQFQIKPFIALTMPKGNRISCRRKFGGQRFTDPVLIAHGCSPHW
jgi:hypothetical protein